MPKWLIYAGVIGVALLSVPPVLVLRARAVKSPNPRIHIIQDMDAQPKFKPQQANLMFADHRAMRPHIRGTVARGDLVLDDHWARGQVDGEWATTFPSQFKINDTAMQRGQEQYDIFCAPCHGYDGYGGGSVSLRAEALQEGTWIPPTSFHMAQTRERSVGHLYNTITNGIRNMPAYGPQVPIEDRWAIVLYIRALQRSQDARIEDVPVELRDELR
jgi:mono/diheme cytochrome c family protein